MTEGFGDPTPNRRGRRDPQLREQLDMSLMESDEEAIQAAGEEIPDIGPMLYPGAIVSYKAVKAVKIDGMDNWFTYHAMDRVQEHETESDAFIRLVTVVNTRVLDAAEDAAERDAELVEALRQRDRDQRQSMPQRRITPRR